MEDTPIHDPWKIARTHPCSLIDVVGELGAAPISCERRRAFDPQLPDLPVGEKLPVAIADLNSISGERPADASGDNIVGQVGRNVMHRLRGSESVKQRQAESILESEENFGRKRLRGGDRDPHRGGDARLRQDR